MKRMKDPREYLEEVRENLRKLQTQQTVTATDNALFGMIDGLAGLQLTAQERINDALLDGDTLRPNGRIVSVSSQSGIAGNAGQANYATSKAAVIGMVESMAPVLAGRPATINAVAPGFIETQMTAAMPTFTREAGRRLNMAAGPIS